MKKHTLSVETLRSIAEYALYLGLFCVFSLSKLGPVRPFATGLFFALAYCRKNIWLLAPLLLAAAVVGELSWQSVLLSGVAVVVCLVGYYAHHLAKKKMNRLHLVLYAALSRVPVLFVYGLSPQNLVWGVVDVALHTLFTVAALAVAYAVIVKRGQAPTTSEQAALGLLLSAVALGLWAVEIGGVRPGFLLLGAAVVAASLLWEERGFLPILAVGLGLCAGSESPAYALLATLWAVGCYALRRGHPLLCVPLIVGVELVCGLWWGILPAWHYANCVLGALGALAVGLVPQKMRARARALFEEAESTGVRYLINRTRLETYEKIKGTGAVLADMRAVLAAGILNLPALSDNKNQLAKALAEHCCAGCERRGDCERMLGSSTAVVMYELIQRALEAGRLSLLETPSFLSEYCHKMKGVLATCGDMLEEYAERKATQDVADRSKSMMCEQLEGLEGMMRTLSGEVKQVAVYDTQREKKLMERLAHRNIWAKDAIIYHTGKAVEGEVQPKRSVSLVVRKRDVEKEALGKTLEELLGKMVRTSLKNQAGGWVSVQYVSAPAFGLVTGEAAHKKEGSDLSGDTYSVLPLGTERVLLAICDGMGSGKGAKGGSEAAMSLVESFYSAGIADDVILPLINKLLSVRNEESFQALDICVVNLQKGFADFIKLGAPESVVRHADRIEVVQGGALPLGILEQVEPKVCRVQLGKGDMIMMASDGISESIGVEGMVRVSEQNTTVNPSTLAHLAVEDALFVDRKDDKTVLCARLYANR
ncbi:MAG: SpoIIE family protein phosphatase [Clostridia bacterium]|nr:SpoIIE family protein phosphatase [Clostridia bacterium]